MKLKVLFALPLSLLLAVPSMAASKTFTANDFGAKGDGKTL